MSLSPGHSYEGLSPDSRLCLQRVIEALRDSPLTFEQLRAKTKFPQDKLTQILVEGAERRVVRYDKVALLAKSQCQPLEGLSVIRTGDADVFVY
jgi:hypothetical protein